MYITYAHTYVTMKNPEIWKRAKSLKGGKKKEKGCDYNVKKKRKAIKEYKRLGGGHD